MKALPWKVFSETLLRVRADEWSRTVEVRLVACTRTEPDQIVTLAFSGVRRLRLELKRGRPGLRVGVRKFTIRGREMAVRLEADYMTWTAEKLTGGWYDGA